MNKPTLWTAAGLAALFVAAFLFRTQRAPTTLDPDGGPTTPGQAGIPGPARGHPSFPTTPSVSPPTADLPPDVQRVRDLLVRHRIDPRALHAAHRAAWQASEFRRLTAASPLAQTAYLDLLNDREKLHLELEFGVTNSPFLQEVFALEIDSPPAMGRPELLVPTEKSVALHDFHLQTQGTTEPMKRITAVLEEHGVTSFPLALRALEDVALLEACLERHAAIEKTRDQLVHDARLAPDSLAEFELDVINSLSGVQALETVLSRSFASLSGIDNPSLPATLRSAASGAAFEIRPIRPPADAQDMLRRWESQPGTPAPAPAPQQPSP